MSVADASAPDPAGLRIEWRPPDTLTPHPDNPRTIPQDAIDNVAGSIERYGWRQPIVADGDGFIVVGHTRWHAARKLGLRMVPVHVADDLDDTDLDAYRIRDNRSNELSGWDIGGLIDGIHHLNTLLDTPTPVEIADMTGFAVPQIESLLEIVELDETPPQRPSFWVTLSIDADRCQELRDAAMQLADKLGAVYESQTV